jgi:AraC family transcriptional regulator
MRLSIKNMVCNRCILVVGQEFEKVGINPIAVSMGEVELAEPLTNEQAKEIGERLTKLGFEILDGKNRKLIEQIKTLLITQVQSGEVEEHFGLSEFIARHLNKEYTQVSRLFSEVEGITLEQFFILQKIEKVKEWLVYDELTLSEISYKLGYSSVAHLSAQFKKVTGFTPSAFKKIGISHRQPLDRVQKPK